MKITDLQLSEYGIYRGGVLAAVDVFAECGHGRE